MQHATGAKPHNAVWRMKLAAFDVNKLGHLQHQSVRMCVGRASYLEGVRHSQTDDARAQGVFSHHRENGSS